MFRRKLILSLVIISLLSLPLTTFAQSSNLVLNPSFESGLINWQFGEGIPGTYTISADTTTSVVGDTSLHLSSTDPRNNFWGYQVAPIESNTNYVFAGHLKTNISTSGNAFFFIQAFSAGWKYVSYTFNSGDNSAIGVRTQLEWADGTGWFDGLRLYPVNNPSVNLIINPSFEPDLSGWEWGYGVPGTFSIQQDATTAKDGNVSVKLSSTDTRNNFWGGQLVPLEPNTDYVFGGWLKQEASAGHAFFYLLLEPSRIGTYIGWSATGTGNHYVGAPSAGRWSHYGVVINSGEADNFLIRSQLEWATGDVWADGISLYKDAVPVIVDVRPEPLILGSPDFISAFIEVPEEFFLDEINISSVTLNGILADTTFSNMGDYDSDGVPDLQLIFPRDQFEQTVTLGANAIVLDGLILGLPLKGSDGLTVQSPVEAIQDIIAKVEEFNLQQGIDNSLDAKLDVALQSLQDINENNDVAAINSLEAFINAVEAQRGNKLTDAQANDLVTRAQAVIASLSS